MHAHSGLAASDTDHHPAWTSSTPARPPIDPGAALAILDDTVASFMQLLDTVPHSSTDLLHETAAAMHRFSTAVLICERAGLDRATLLPHLQSLRALHARSPFVARLQVWPRGYAGDFETIEYICDARNQATPGTVSWAIEECALQSPVAQQHRNKVGLQARAILSTVLGNPEARVASIGCGGCRDLSLIQDYLAPDQGRFVLVDADAHALEFARTRLTQIADRCEMVAGSVPRVLTRLNAREPFDIVVAGGLFDYLPDRWALSTLKAIGRMLKPGGRLLFSNIAEGNPFRPWIEYLADWTLNERGPADVEQLILAADMPVASQRIFRDSTSLALMIDLTTAPR
jgi:extracellular factor (EF) 3-hydroxypalmitic acid methyl ester biosynthesis protein